MNDRLIDEYEESRELIESNLRDTSTRCKIYHDHDYRDDQQTSLVYFDETKCKKEDDY